MRYQLAPSLLAADFARLGDGILAVERAGAHYLHFDVMDGHFVPNLSFGVPVLSGIRPVTALPFDVHLMITRPERLLDTFALAGADILNVHLEAAADLPGCLRHIHALGKKAAFTISPATPASAALPYMALADMVLVMSVEPGFGGQPFMPEALKKAEILAEYVQKHGLSTWIEMDGGIDLSNAASALNAGVNILVAGSAIFGQTDAETAARVRRFLQL